MQPRKACVWLMQHMLVEVQQVRIDRGPYAAREFYLVHS